MLSIGKSGSLLALTALMTLLMITMGVWQLSRADEKRLLLQEWQQRRDIGLALNEALAMSSPFGYRLEAGGVYLAGGNLFLDNQMKAGRVGYRLIRPLQTRYGLLAVDAGWWPADPDRRQLPRVPAQEDEDPVRLSGNIIRPYVPPLSLGEAPFNPQHPSVVSLDPSHLERIWGQSVLPFVLKLGADDWQPVVMGPERHIGYAVQWFAMTLAVCIAAVWWVRRRDDA